MISAIKRCVKAALRPVIKPLIERIAESTAEKLRGVAANTYTRVESISRAVCHTRENVTLVEKDIQHVKRLLLERGHDPQLLLECLEIDDYSSTGGLNIQLQTTSVCTGECIMCPYPESWHKQNPGTMTDQVFQTIIDQLADYPIRKICPYLENEPLADPLIFQRIQTIRNTFPNSLIEVSTNALALTEEKTHALIDSLAGGPHEIGISFHGMDKRTFEGIMGIPFEKCFANIVYLLKTAQSIPLNIKIRGAGRGKDPSLNHEFCFSEQEYRSFWENIFQDNGISKRPEVNYFPYHDRAMSITRNGIRMSRPVRPDLRGFSCPRVSEWLHFLYTGELVLCCMDYHRETVFADIREQSLSDILNGEAYAKTIKKVTGIVGTAPNFICKRCISPNG